MGPASSPARETVKVSVPGIPGVLGGIWVDMPNPHTVVELTDEETLRGVFLPTVDVSQIPQAQRPSYDPAPQAGTNLELVVDLTEPGATRGHIAMRVLERGVGETQACGTGCCAAALATALRRCSSRDRRRESPRSACPEPASEETVLESARRPRPRRRGRGPQAGRTSIMRKPFFDAYFEA